MPITPLPPPSRFIGGIVHAFCVEGLRGNPAFVFATGPDDDVSDHFCTRMASRLGCEVTWIQRSPSFGVELRFFTAGGEIAFCGHGVLAAAAWLNRFETMPAPMTFYVADDAIVVQQDVRGRWSYVQAEFGFDPIASDTDLHSVLASLGLSPASVMRQFGAKLFRSVGAPREKLLVELPNAGLLSNIMIDAALRDDVCRRLSATGIYAFTMGRHSGSADILARHFPIYCAHQEDMATGGIAPTIAHYAGHSLKPGEVTVEQGGMHCQNARLVVSEPTPDGMRRVAGECVASEYETFDTRFERRNHF